MSFDISDLTGLGRVTRRIIDVVSAGVGKVSQAYFSRATARAKAYEMREIGKAMDDVTADGGKQASYDDGAVKLWSTNALPSSGAVAQTTAERIQQRIEFQETKRQQNIESITFLAATELEGETEVPQETPDKDWIVQFFSNAQDVSNEEMRKVWARILAGEIKLPGSFSLRTMEFVRTMTQHEALALERVAPFVFRSSGEAYLLPLHISPIASPGCVLLPDVLMLCDAGIIGSERDLNLQFFAIDKEETVTYCGKTLTLTPHAEGLVAPRISVRRFTLVGQQLLDLCRPIPDEVFANSLTKMLTRIGNLPFSDAKGD